MLGENKNRAFGCNLIALFFILLTSVVSASESNQDESEYRIAITHPLVIYPEGSLEEALSLSKEWRDKVLLKNPHILKVDYLLEQQSETRHQLMVIYYYKNRKTAAQANAQIGKLISEAWPNKKDRSAFFNKLQSYVVQEEKETFKFDLVK